MAPTCIPTSNAMPSASFRTRTKYVLHILQNDETKFLRANYPGLVFQLLPSSPPGIPSKMGYTLQRQQCAEVSGMPSCSLWVARESQNQPSLCTCCEIPTHALQRNQNVFSGMLGPDYTTAFDQNAQNKNEETISLPSNIHNPN